MAFRIASSPYTHNQQNVSHIMLMVILACIPGILVQYYFFGYGVLIQLILAIITALFAEALVLKLRKISIKNRLADNSALLTAILLAISIPSLAPWWIIVIGTLFAIVIAKQLYGGLGQNPFNPAMIGYVVLLISFPVQMTSWLPPSALQSVSITLQDTVSVIFTHHTTQGYALSELLLNADGISQATPLDTFKTDLRNQTPVGQILAKPIFSSLSGIGWEWVNAAFFAGGVFLLWRKIIQWQIPVAFLISLLFCSLVSWWIAPEKFAPPLMHLLSGATMLGAFFIATDPVTASTTTKGRLIFGALIGCLVWLLRAYGGYPDGVAFAVLIANMSVPLIDHYTQPTAYGHRK